MKKRNYWTKDRCHSVAMRFKARSEFNRVEHCVYITSYKNGWLDEICSHMASKKKHSKDECFKISCEFKTRNDFKKSRYDIYYYCDKMGWLDEICSHMKKIKHWDIKSCEEVARLCSSRTEFCQKYKSAYVISSRNGWLDTICVHMMSKTHKMGYWDKKRCQEEADKYRSRSEFQKNSRGYRPAYENGWLDEICSHMTPIGNIFKRLIYACEFPNNIVYVGLTCNFNRRIKEHSSSRKSPVFRYISTADVTPSFIKLTDYLESKEAADLEVKYIKNYIERGYIVINSDKGGGLGGGSVKWTYESCKKESFRYRNRTEFCKNKRKAYEKSKTEGWLDEFYPISSS